ncbi:MAG: hypothetical protein ACKV1O_16675 [Saprospiraceae bacterium]
MRIFILAMLFNVAYHVQAQQIIHFQNASFEGEPQDATVPVGWLPCEPGSTPDILPGQWGVYQEASDGTTYLGLITREDGTWESVGQRLQDPLEANECYAFQFNRAYAKTYAGYNNPVKLRVWGGQTKCSKDQMLYQTDFIKHINWKTYEVRFRAKQPINYLIIEAYYSDKEFSHKGNILVDKLTPLKKCPRV